ncbi:hypothetical protein [Desulfosporosinus sp. I2]|uniref:hypothetical protein n=1 Tax=Desulfosporosinus sp. I2 TaxID=1617025 RepID=UPI0005ED8CBB|nr:hypothetical protein [Desulfosporosinus sp. I2]
MERITQVLRTRRPTSTFTVKITNDATTIDNAGIYLLTFQVGASGASGASNQFAVYLGGTEVTGSRFGIDQALVNNLPNYGQMIFEADAGATATLKNNDSSSGTVALSTGAGGTLTATNASIVIHRLN